MKTPKTTPKAKTVSIREAALQAAQLATIMTGQTLTDFVSESVVAAAAPIIRKNAGRLTATVAG